MFENPLIEPGLRRQVYDAKQRVYYAVQQALHDAGIDNAYVTSIEVRMGRTGPKCPPGTEPTLKEVEGPDGSTSYIVVCT